MTIKEYDTEEEMDADFARNMEYMQEEARLKDEICYAQERVASAHDQLNNAEEELIDLRRQLEALEGE